MSRRFSLFLSGGAMWWVVFGLVPTIAMSLSPRSSNPKNAERL